MSKKHLKKSRMQEIHKIVLANPQIFWKLNNAETEGIKKRLAKHRKFLHTIYFLSPSCLPFRNKTFKIILILCRFSWHTYFFNIFPISLRSKYRTHSYIYSWCILYTRGLYRGWGQHSSPPPPRGICPLLFSILCFVLFTV